MPSTSTPSPTTQKDNPVAFSDTLLLIPTLNEEKAIVGLIAESRSHGFEKIMVVDGFSSDLTRELAEQAGVRVVLQDFGKGKGCGIRTGMREFLQTDARVLCIMDGDGTNDPAFLARMVGLVESGEVDVVLGSRTRGPREPQAMNVISLASNLTVSLLLAAKFGRLFSDIQTGYWTLGRSAVERTYPTIQSTGFEVELELFVRIMKEGLRMSEIPVGFRRRTGDTKFSFAMRIRNLYYAFKFLAS